MPECALVHASVLCLLWCVCVSVCIYVVRVCIYVCTHSHLIATLAGVSALHVHDKYVALLRLRQPHTLRKRRQLEAEVT